MEKIFMIYVGFLLIKAVLVMLPMLVKNTIFNVIPRRQYTAEEVIACKHIRPEIYYKKQLEVNTNKKSKVKKYKLQPKEVITLQPIKTNNIKHEEVEISVIRERFKNKMKHKQLTRSQIIAIRRYLEELIDCKEKKFDNDCHCIYFCLKQLDKEQILDLTALANLLK